MRLTVEDRRQAWATHGSSRSLASVEEGTHYHTYGLLTPYFKGLAEGRLMATRCLNPRVPDRQGATASCGCRRAPTARIATSRWCGSRSQDPRGYIYTYTQVERGGTGLEIECPYYQIDVKIEGVCTIVKSYLIGPGPVRIGDRVKARFRTGAEATHTCLDLYWEPA